MALIDKLIPLIEKGDKKSIAKAKELIQNEDIGTTELNIQSVTKFIKELDRKDTLRLLRYVINNRIDEIVRR